MLTMDDLQEAYTKQKMVHIETMYNEFDGYINRYDRNMIDMALWPTGTIMIPFDMVEEFSSK